MAEDNYQFNSKGYFDFIRKWKYVLLTTTTLALISSIVFSLLIDDKYESSVILFPSTTSSISRALLDNVNYKEKDYLEFGEETEAEQMIQILKSDAIRQHIIEKFDLMNHYKINSTDKYKKTVLNNQYDNNISFYRTKFTSVKIDVLDKDPQYAADIANEIAIQLDSVKNNMLQKVAIQGFKIVSKEYYILVNEIKRMEDTLSYIRSKGIQDYESQAEALNNQFGAALVKNNSKAAQTILSKLDTLSKYGGQYLSLSQQMEYEREKLSDLRKMYAEARVNAESVLDQKFIVNNAYPAEKASYPVRWLIVLVSTVATFLFTMIVLIILDPKK